MTIEAGFINTPEAQQAAIDQRNVIANKAEVGSIRANQFTFFAAFDGTSNSYIPSNGDPQNTNVAQLYDQVRNAAFNNSNLAVGYESGPGTEGTLTASAWLAPQVTKQAAIAAENMYAKFNQAAADWIKNNPDSDVRANPGDYITTAVTAFSRGVASAAIFSQLVAARGVTDPETGKVLVSPGETGVSSGVIFDPVTTGVDGNLAFANSENILVLEAGNEYRYLFKSTDYSAQNGVQTLEVLGNHCNTGGCYDNSLGALYLEGATKFFQLSGLSIANVDPSRQFDPTERMVIYDEVGSYNSTGNLVRQWDTSGTYTTGASSQPQRLIDHNATVTEAATSYTSTTVADVFTMYNGAKISNIRTIADTPVGGISATGVSNLINGATTGTTTDNLSKLISDNVNTPFFSGNSTTNGSFGNAALVRAIAGTQTGNESWGGQTFIGASVVGMNVPAFNPTAGYGLNVASSFNEVYGLNSFITPFSSVPSFSPVVAILPDGSRYTLPTFIISFPIVLDLNQNGIELINPDQSTAFFDFTDSGYRSHTGWVSANDGFLTFDGNRNGRIDQAKELALSLWTENTSDTDLDALKAVFDTNHDNILDAQDANFSDFKVWQDKNSDGVSDDGELKTLSEMGITSFNLNATNINLSLNGNQVQGLSQFTKSDGTTSTFADVGLGHDADGWKIEAKAGYQLLTKSDGTSYAIASGTSGLTLNVAQNNLSSAIGSAGADNFSSTGAAAVMLQGKDGNDVITGGSGDDWLEGGAGVDSISGGAGDDTIFIDASDNLANISGGGGSDTLVIQGNVGVSVNITSLGMEYGIGGDGNDSLSVSRPNIRPNYQSTILYGSAGDDALYGAAGNDILSGGTGNDVLYGDWGQDTYIFNKGDGRDTIYDYTSTTINYVDYTIMTGEITQEMWAKAPALIGSWLVNRWLNGGDRLQQLASLSSGTSQDVLRMGNNVSYSDILVEYSGYDLLVGIRQAGVASVRNLADYVTITNWAYSQHRVEYIQFSDGTKFSLEGLLIGTSGANILTGNSSDNLLSGLEGADTMSGGLGNDVYTVDDSNDIVIESGNQGTDLVESTVTYILADNVENLRLVGSEAINGSGNQLNNVITGNAKDNVLNGGDGVDTLMGGDGNDTYVVDTTTDTITETSIGGIDTVQSSVAFTLGQTSNLENLTLTGVAAINGVGNSLNNVLVGNSANNTLDGGAGNDTLDGGAGIDTLIGGDGNDTYIVDTLTDIITENVSGGVDTVISSVTYTLAPSSNLESLALSGIAAINGTGNALNNRIIGNDAANILDGGVGVDALIGGDGSDTYIVDTVTDTITETTTGGVDTVQTSVSYTLGVNSNLENLTLTGAGAINGTGNALNNVITGNNASNTLNGGAGNDIYVLNVGFGQDLIVDTDSTAGNIDTIQFGAGINSSTVLVSRSGNNLLLTVGSNIATVQNWFSSASNQVEQIKFVDSPGLVWNTNQILAMINTPPTAANATLTTSEDVVKVFTISDFRFSDVNAGDTLQSVTITTLPGTGSLQLNGINVTVNQVITAANISSGLLTYTPALNANGNGYASIGFKVSDGTAFSSAYTLTLNVTAVNDAPIATNLGASEIYTKNVALNLKDIVITDVDSATHTVTLTLSNVAAGSLNTATSGVVTSTYNVSTGVWTASGATANVNALLAGLTFTPTANYNGSFTVATSVSDGVGPAITGSKSLNVVGGIVPTITNNGASEVYTEDVALNLIDMVITDSDSSIHTATLKLSNVAAGILNTATSGSVTSTYNASTGVWSASGATANLNALLAGLTFTPSNNYNGNFTLSTSFTDGITTVTGSKSFTGTAVNDAPTSVSATLTTVEDAPKVFALSDFGFSDVDVGNSLQSVTITTLPVAGMLKLNGAAVTANQVITSANITSGLLTFMPSANANGTGYASFGFKVSDGAVVSTSSYTITMNVTALNDAPTASNATLTAIEDILKVFTLSDFGFSDVDIGNTLQSVTITSLPSAGSLKLGGVAVTANQVISSEHINSGLLTFLPSTNANGTNYASIGFKVSDGTAISGAAYTLTMNVAAVNDAPTATNIAVSETYTKNVALNLNDIVITDIDSATHTATLTLSNVAAGSLNTATSGAVTSTYNASTGVWTASGATANVNALLAGLTFTPSTNYIGSFTIATSVSDGVAPATTGTKSFSVAGILAPTITNLNLSESYTEDMVLNLADMRITDLDSSSHMVTITLSNIAAGRFNTPTSGNATSILNVGAGVWSASGATADINAILADLTFTPTGNYNGDFTISTSVSDGITTVTGSKSFTGTAVNDSPEAINLWAQEAYAKNVALNLQDIVISDIDSTSHTVTLTLQNVMAGSLSTGTSGNVTSTYNAMTGVWSASGATANLNTLLAGLTFIPATDFTGNFAITGVVSDGISSVSSVKYISVPGQPFMGTAVGETLMGTSGDDIMYGLDGNDNLQGGLGADIMVGGKGQDNYFVDNVGDVVIENPDEGVFDFIISDISLNLNSMTNLSSKEIENYTLNATWDEVYFVGDVTRTTGYRVHGNSMNNSITGSLGDDYLRGGQGADVLNGSAGSDTAMYYTSLAMQANLSTGQGKGGEAQGDTFISIENVEGSRYSDLLIGSSENNWIIGTYSTSNGNDVMQGLAGNDYLYTTGGNNLLDGGAGADVLGAESGNDLIVAGKDSDTITTGTGNDLIMFNKGDGTDIINASVGTDNTLSLGGNFAYSDLSLSRSVNDLILKVGSSDHMTFKDWYLSSANNKSILNMQIIAEGVQGFNLGSSDALRNNKIETFNFLSLVGAFDAAGFPANWQLTDTRLTPYLISGSNVAALGGDIAYQYGKTGSLAGMGFLAAQAVINSSAVGQSAQTLNDASSWANESDKLFHDSIMGTLNVDSLMGTVLDDVIYGLEGNDTINGGAGNDTLNGGGGADALTGGVGNDTYIVDMTTDTITEFVNEGTDTVKSSLNYTLGANLENLTLVGDSALIGRGNELSNVIVAQNGGSGAVLFGMENVDQLFGGYGDDTLDGGTGADIMQGGLGNDVYIVDNASDIVIEQINSGNSDLISAYVDYTMALNVEYMILNYGGSAITATGNYQNNYIRGNTQNNILYGLEGDDTLDGDAGADTLVGGDGIDTLIGGDGNDIYIVDTTTDIITETATGGVDTVQSRVTYTLGSSSNLENLTLTGTAAINGTGNALNNVITGNNDSNIIDGGSGIDTLIGGDANDTYIVDTTTDTIIETITGGIDTVNSSVTFTLGVSSNLENLTLTSTAAINGTGNSLNNILIGNTGNNTLDGGNGDDTLDGGAGIDILIGGAGNDTYVIDSTTDTITELSTGGTDTIKSSVTYTLGSYLENITLTGTSNLNGFGNMLDNVIIGNSGANTLNGFGGLDSLIGGAGNDVYIVDTATDIIIENANEGVDTVLSDVSYVLGANIENLTLTAVGGAINGTGNSLSNAITGNAYNNTLDGGDGNDYLAGGNGNDTYIVDTTYDTIVETATGGIDTVKSSVTYIVGASSNLENLTLTGSAAIDGTGNSLTNFLLGNSANNTLTDTVGGNDILQGLGGVDTLNDTSGNNLLDGGIGADVIAAGNGSDLIIGGQGNDTITTGNGYDVIMFNKGDSADTVNASIGTDNTLSLGGNFAYSDLFLTKSTNDLIIKMGTTDQITFKGWYNTAANNKSVINLQVVAEAMQGFSLGGSDALRNNKVETFNFANLVSAFDAAGATANWQLTDARLTAHLSSGSDTSAIGGDIAYQYGKNGSLTGVGLLAAQSVINNANVGQSAQTLNAASSWAAETIKLS